YSQTVTVAGATGSLTFSQSGGIPPGFTLSSDGVLGRTTTQAGTYYFTVTATDTNNISTSESYTLTINPAGFSKYDPTVPASPFHAGSGFVVTVQAADTYGNPVSSYTGPSTVVPRVAPTDPRTTFPSTVSLNSSGLGYFLLTIDKSGTYTISVADGTNTY